jgi:hypothetical protein
VAITARRADRNWVLVVACFVVLNVADLGLTLHLVSRGASELNPVMARLLEAGWAWAAGFKVIMTLGVAAGLWFGRGHLLVRRTGVAFLMLFAAITAYQVIDLGVA